MTGKQGSCSRRHWSAPFQLSEKWVFPDGDGGHWWLSLAEDRAFGAKACRDCTPNPQLLLIVIFLHRSTRRHEWLYLLKLKIVPGLQAEQHSGNRCRVVRWRVEVNPPNRLASTKEEGGGASSGRGMVAVMLATALLLLTVGGWPLSTLAALLRPLPSAAAVVALWTSMQLCQYKGGVGRGGCGGGGVQRYSYFLQLFCVWCKFPTMWEV